MDALFLLQNGEAEEDDEGCSKDDEGCSTVAESTASVHEQHRLENKLRELRDKKRGIDQLLADLRTMKASQQLLNNGI